MSVVLCLPAHLCVSPQRPVAGPPRGRVTATSAPSPLATACPPLSPAYPVPAEASPFCSCPCVCRPSRCTVSRLSGDAGDDTRADDAECVGEGGCGGGAASIRTKSTLIPTSPGHPYPLKICGGGVAAAADDGLDFGSGVWDR